MLYRLKTSDGIRSEKVKKLMYCRLFESVYIWVPSFVCSLFMAYNNSRVILSFLFSNISLNQVWFIQKMIKKWHSFFFLVIKRILFSFLDKLNKRMLYVFLDNFDFRYENWSNPKDKTTQKARRNTNWYGLNNKNKMKVISEEWMIAWPECFDVGHKLSSRAIID